MRVHYIPELHITDVGDGGYIIHGAIGRENDIERAKFAMGRAENTIAYLNDEGLAHYQPVKYYNWINLHFPLSTPQVISKLPMYWKDVEENIKQAIYKIEAHLVYDRLFENFLVNKGFQIHEWKLLTQIEKDEFVQPFILITDFTVY